MRPYEGGVGVDTYTCPACGGIASAPDGCRTCGRPYDSDAAALAMLQRSVANLEQKKRDLHSDTVTLRGQLAHVTAQRDSMRRKIRQRMADEEATKGGRRGRKRQRGAETSAGGSATTTDIRPEPPAQRTPPASRTPAGPSTPAAPSTPTATRTQRMPGWSPRAPGGAPPTPPPPRKALPPAPPISPDDTPASTERPTAEELAAERIRRAIVQPRQRGFGNRIRRLRGRRSRRTDAPETTAGTMQTAVLVLGGVLLAGGAIVLAFFAFGGVGAVTRASLLGIITVGLLATPVLLATRGYRATGETVASVALLLVLLDGYVVRSEGLLGSRVVPATVYFGLVFLITAIIAAAYSAQSHLLAPRYATLLALQPVLPLTAYEAIGGPAGWALVLSAVAVVDLVFGVALGRTGARQLLTGRVAEPVDGEPPPKHPADELMRDLAWILFALAFGAASAYAIVALSTANGLSAVLRSAAVVLLTAAIGVAGSLSWRRGPIPDVASGIATLAIVAAFARVGSTAYTGHLLFFLALGVALATAGIPLLPADARRGPRYAGSLVAAATSALLIIAALPTIVAPLRAVRPVWHADLVRYHRIVTEAAGPHGWQLVAAALLLTFTGLVIVPERYREDVISAGVPFSALLTPAALGLQWLAAPVLTVIAAIASGILALYVSRARTASILLGAAVILGLYAAATSLAQPSATALILTAITLAGAGIAMVPRPARTNPQAELVARRVTDAAAGGAIFALPGAAAAATAIPFTGIPGGSTAVLVVSFIALTVSLAVAAITQVIRREQYRPRLIDTADPLRQPDLDDDEQGTPLLIGASAATAAVVIATLTVHGIGALDYAVAALMLISAILLWVAPRIDDRDWFGEEFTGADTAMAAVTVAGIAAFARAASLAAPGAELFTVAILVLAVAVAARLLPGMWRRGVVAGGAVAGALAGAYAAVLAMIGAVGVIHAIGRPWHTDLAGWQHNAHELITFGWQIPIALLLLAFAAWIALPQPIGDYATSVAIALAAMAAPIGFNLDWQSPMVIGWAAATALGTWATLARDARGAYTRLVAAGVVGTFGAGASLVRPYATTGTLLALAITAVAIAGLGAFVIATRGSAVPDVLEPSSDQAFIAVVGGSGVAGALLSLTATAIAALFMTHPHASAAQILTGALAAGAAGLGVGGYACRKVPSYLPYVTVGVATGATITSLVALFTDRRSAVVFAAAAALLGVLAELVRVSHGRPGQEWLPARGFRPDATAVPIRAWRRVTVPGGFAGGVAAASGLPAAIVIVFVAPAVAAALLGPYRWVSRPWTATPANASDLGPFNQFAGNETHVVAAGLLTIAAALVAVGLGGGHAAVANRSVAILVPGIALTALIAPAALRWPWPAQPTAALLVSTMAGLGLALTVLPDDLADDRLLRGARRFVFVIAALSGLAGGAGSLATKQQTLTWLAGSIIVGLIGALWGKYPLARMVGWQVAASTAEGLALAIGLAIGLPTRQCAFLVLLVATLLLILAAMLPRLRPTTSSVVRESLVIEGAGYFGALGALALTYGYLSHTGAVLVALGAILGVSAARPARTGAQRVWLIIAAAVSELIAIWLLLITAQVRLIEAYTLPFAVLALITGLLQIRRRPELGSWVAYGPALVAGFLPSLVTVLRYDSPPLRRVLLIVAAVVTVAIGATRRQKAPVIVGSVVTVIATLHELLVSGLPWPVMLLLFGGTGGLLLFVGANYEQRRRFTGAYRGMR